MVPPSGPIPRVRRTTRKKDVKLPYPSTATRHHGPPTGEVRLSREGPHRVVAGVMGDLGQAERLEQRWEVHAEPATVAVSQPIPTADRVVRRPPPGLDGALGRGLLLIGGTQRDPVALLQEPGMQVLDGPEP